MTQSAKNSTNPVLLLIMSWIVPGSGHFRLGKLFRAATFFVSVSLLFWLGIYLKAYFTFPDTPNETFAIFKFIGALSTGFHFPLAYLLNLGQGDLNVYRAALTNEYGNTCLYTAGILNMLAMIDALDIRNGRKS